MKIKKALFTLIVITLLTSCAVQQETQSFSFGKTPVPDGNDIYIIVVPDQVFSIIQEETEIKREEAIALSFVVSGVAVAEDLFPVAGGVANDVIVITLAVGLTACALNDSCWNVVVSGADDLFLQLKQVIAPNNPVIVLSTSAMVFEPTDKSEGFKNGVYLTVAWITQDFGGCHLLGSISKGEKLRVFKPYSDPNPCSPELIVGWLVSLEQQIRQFGDDAWDIARAIGASLK